MKQFYDINVYVYGFVFAYSLEWFYNLLAFDIYKRLNLTFHQMLIVSLVGSISSALSAHLIPKLNRFVSLKSLCFLQVVLYLIALSLLIHSESINLQILAKILAGFGAGILFSCFDLWLCLHVENNGLDYKNVAGSALLWNSCVAVFLGIFIENIYSYFWIFGLFALFSISNFNNYLSPFEKQNDDGSKTPIPKFEEGFYKLLCCQVCFECSIVLFVFSWQNIYSLHDATWLSQSKMFSILMLVAGFSSYLSQYMKVNHIKLLLISSFLGFSLFYIMQSFEVMMITFLIFECVIGSFFPVIGAIREQWDAKTRSRYQSLTQILINLLVAIVVFSANILKFDENEFVILIVASLFGASYFGSRIKTPEQIKNA